MESHENPVVYYESQVRYWSEQEAVALRALEYAVEQRKQYEHYIEVLNP